MVRPSPYDPKRHPKRAKLYTEKGLTTYQIAAKFGISRQTLYNWTKAHPEFLDALMGGRNFIVSEVVLSTFQRARGYEYEEVKSIGVPKTKKDENGNMVEYIKIVRVEKTKKHQPADPGSAKILLNAYAPQDFKNSMEHTGKGGGPIKTEGGMSRADLCEIAADIIRLSGK